MHRSRVPERSAILLLLFLLLPLFFTATAHAQLPGAPEEQSFGVSVQAEKSSVHIDYLGTEFIDLNLIDISQPSGATDQVIPVRGQILLDAEVVGSPVGWAASPVFSAVSSRPGENHTVPIKIDAGATIDQPRVTVQVDIIYRVAGDDRQHLNLSLLAVAKPNAVVNLQMDGAPHRFSPDERAQVPLIVRNDDYYPHMINFQVQAADGWVVSPPSSIQLAPGERQRILVDIKAPDDPWFRFNPTSPLSLITAQVSDSPGVQYTTSISTPISGWFLPGWAMPHILLFLIGAAAFVRTRQVHREEKIAEQGKPEYPGLDLEGEARLAALKARDPDRAEAMEEKLQARHVKRKQAWKGRYKKRQELERKMAEREKARHAAVLAAQREEEREKERARKAREKELETAKKEREARLEELREKRAKAEKRQEKARRKEEKRLRKEREQKAKEKRKKLEKLRKEKAKREKKLAKQREKEAKRKRKKLEKLRKEKAKMEKKGSGESPWWKPWG